MADVRIELRCDGCRKTFLVPATQQGKIAECPHCGGWVDVPVIGEPAGGDPDLNDDPDEYADEDVWQRNENRRQLEEAARQQEETRRQIEEAARQIEQAQLALDHRDQQDARFDVLLDRLDAVIQRWDDLATRIYRAADRPNNEGE